jgi:hypothetical protein
MQRLDLGATDMTRSRSKRQRPVSFEALEGRLVLSTGMGMAMVPHHSHSPAMSTIHIPASFKGRVQISGTTLTVTDLRGKIAGSPMTGYGTGTAVGRQFEGGTVWLSNSAGTIELGLGPDYVVKVKGHPKRDVPVTIVNATGPYAGYIGITGTLTSWNVPAKPTKNASFSGTFTG